MLLEPLCFPLGYVTMHAFRTESHIVVLWLEALQTLANYLVDMNGFCWKLQGNVAKTGAMWFRQHKLVFFVVVTPYNVLHSIFSFPRCQKAVLNELELGDNIARNTALSENVFMMVVCIELRIPLFVVGKPGSSKSLAKTVVTDNMLGDASRSDLFKRFKQVGGWLPMVTGYPFEIAIT